MIADTLRRGDAGMLKVAGSLETFFESAEPYGDSAVGAWAVPLRLAGG